MPQQLMPLSCLRSRLCCGVAAPALHVCSGSAPVTPASLLRVLPATGVPRCHTRESPPPHTHTHTHHCPPSLPPPFPLGLSQSLCPSARARCRESGALRARQPSTPPGQTLRQGGRLGRAAAAGGQGEGRRSPPLRLPVAALMPAKGGLRRGFVQASHSGTPASLLLRSPRHPHPPLSCKPLAPPRRSCPPPSLCPPTRPLPPLTTLFPFSPVSFACRRRATLRATPTLLWESCGACGDSAWWPPTRAAPAASTLPTTCRWVGGRWGGWVEKVEWWVFGWGRANRSWGVQWMLAWGQMGLRGVCLCVCVWGGGGGTVLTATASSSLLACLLPTPCLVASAESVGAGVVAGWDFSYVLLGRQPTHRAVNALCFPSHPPFPPTPQPTLPRPPPPPTHPQHNPDLAAGAGQEAALWEHFVLLGQFQGRSHRWARASV
jgi:hypothetical protein